MRYTVLIDGEAGGYGVVFPDLPGCTAMGSTLDGALANAADAARDWAGAVESRGGTVPAPSPVERLREDVEVARALAEGAALGSVVVLRETGRSVKANLSLDTGVLAAIDAAAERLRITRSATVELLAKQGLPRLS